MLQDIIPVSCHIVAGLGVDWLKNGVERRCQSRQEWRSKKGANRTSGLEIQLLGEHTDAYSLGDKIQ